MDWVSEASAAAGGAIGTGGLAFYVIRRLMDQRERADERLDRVLRALAHIEAGDDAAED